VEHRRSERMTVATSSAHCPLSFAVALTLGESSAWASFPSSFRFFPFCGGSLGRPRELTLPRPVQRAMQRCITVRSRGRRGACTTWDDAVLLIVGAGHHIVDNGATRWIGHLR